MPRHYNMQACPYCRGDNISMYKSNGTQFLFCSDCEEEYELTSEYSFVKEDSGIDESDYGDNEDDW
jgi:hypothetical protein